MENNIKILIVENEMNIASNISLQLINLGYHVTEIISRGEEVLLSIENELPNIILMDINLKGDLDGIDIVHLIQKKQNIPIIYLTANADEVSFNRAKQTHPHAFLSKPFKKIDLIHTIELTVQRLNDENNINISLEDSYILSDSIYIRSSDKMIKVIIKNVLYIEAERNYCKIHCKEKQLLIVSTLKELDEKLPSQHFLRIHRSFIVNIAHIDEIATSYVLIAKKAIPITSELKKELLLHVQKV